MSESYDEYEEEDLDGDLSDFIDDGEGEEDVSSAIKEIFGYDKRKYVFYTHILIIVLDIIKK